MIIHIFSVFLFTYSDNFSCLRRATGAIWETTRTKGTWLLLRTMPEIWHEKACKRCIVNNLQMFKRPFWPGVRGKPHADSPTAKTPKGPPNTEYLYSASLLGLGVGHPCQAHRAERQGSGPGTLGPSGLRSPSPYTACSRTDSRNRQFLSRGA